MMEKIHHNKEKVFKMIEDLNLKASKGMLYGELDHPDSFDVHLKNISHRIEKISIDGDQIYGEIEILDTPKGKIAKDLVKHDLLKLEMRAAGTISEENEINIKKIITWDLVPKNRDERKYI